MRIDPSFADAGDVDTALVVLVHESGCITSIDNSRQTSYGYDQRVEVFGSGGMAASENPLRHTGVMQTAEGTTAPPSCRTSSSSATSRATCASGRRSWRP